MHQLTQDQFVREKFTTGKQYYMVKGDYISYLLEKMVWRLISRKSNVPKKENAWK